ncbi:MAG: 2-succinyl-5-enolpyruvyl-6-hydroxy-3-cyclohexene-1-carboxylic-acid synthase [Dehalococcoidia bacterium]|nr:2-succinyl-5-enolpyruvyl-6-hydroxy-3-cyclohexene-1-carboxylic-acid synthase [Dehalococcoidia bacterium]
MPAPADTAVNAFLAQLAASGVCDAVIAPGSRNTPLTLGLTRPGTPFRTWLHLDERSAAYFALGLARQTGRPVAVVCTSGTAAANLLPAAVEATLSRVPLLLLTADRPPELRDVGAAQTIDQVRMFGSHAKWAVDLPVSDGDPATIRAARVTAARAAALALQAPAGPVHLNFPFREPLVDGSPLGPLPADDEPAPIEVPGSTAQPDAETVARLAAGFAGKRGLILAGPESRGLPVEGITALAGALGWPVVADPLSGLRAGTHRLDAVIETADALARVPEFTARAAPEVVLRFGAQPTSKPLNQWLASLEGLRYVVVDPAGGWREPDGIATAVVRSDEAAFCHALLAAAGAPAEPAWRALWLHANAAAREALADAIEVLDEPFEGEAPRLLAQVLPAGATLVVGNSMPVRDVDSFFPLLDRDIRILGTRGASGIDGVVSTAAGAAAAAEGPVALLIGDLSFFHDLNGLWPVGNYNLDLTVLLVNNDGGGIFNFLPQREAAADRFQAWWGTPHALEFRHAVALHHGRHVVLEGDGKTWGAPFADALARPGLDVLEIRTERDRNVALHRQVWERAAQAVREALAAAPAVQA